MRTMREGMRGDDVKRLQQLLHIMDDGVFGPMTREAVVEYQRSHGLDPDGIVGPKTWAALTSSQGALQASKRRIDEIIVHCSATREGQKVTVEQIRQWHLQRGFSDIGYHYVVYLDGSVHPGRPIDKAGAHCTGHNTHSIGVCYIGGCKADGKTPKDTRTPAQKEALLKLLKELRRLYPKASIHGHREYANKACPSFDARKEYKGL